MSYHNIDHNQRVALLYLLDVERGRTDGVMFRHNEELIELEGGTVEGLAPRLQVFSRFSCKSLKMNAHKALLHIYKKGFVHRQWSVLRPGVRGFVYRLRPAGRVIAQDLAKEEDTPK